MKLKAIIQSRTFRAAITLAAIVFVATRVNWRDQPVSTAAGQVSGDQNTALESGDSPSVAYGLVSIWEMSSKSLLLCAVAVFTIVPFLQASRLCWILQRHHHPLSYGQCLSISLRGNFMNFAAPFGSTAGDVCKAYWITRHTGMATESASIVFVDRAIGLGTLLLGVAGVVLIYPDAILTPFRPFVLTITFAGAVCLGLYLLPPVRNHVWMAAIRSRFAILERIDGVVFDMVSNVRTMLLAGVLTLCIHVAAASAFACGFAALRLTWQGHASSFYAAFSLGELVKALPGPPQGLGTMELAYEWLFAGAGTAGQIIAAALIIRAVNLVCALPGGALMMWQQRAVNPVTNPQPALAVAGN